MYNDNNYVDIPKSPRDRTEDGSPKVKRKLGQPSRNFSLASKIFAVLMKWIEICFEVRQHNALDYKKNDLYISSYIGL